MLETVWLQFLTGPLDKYLIQTIQQNLKKFQIGIIRYQSGPPIRLASQPILPIESQQGFIVCDTDFEWLSKFSFNFSEGCDKSEWQADIVIYDLTNWEIFISTLFQLFPRFFECFFSSEVHRGGLWNLFWCLVFSLWYVLMCWSQQEWQWGCFSSCT